MVEDLKGLVLRRGTEVAEKTKEELAHCVAPEIARDEPHTYALPCRDGGRNVGWQLLGDPDEVCRRCWRVEGVGDWVSGLGIGCRGWVSFKLVGWRVAVGVRVSGGETLYVGGMVQRLGVCKAQRSGVCEARRLGGMVQRLGVCELRIRRLFVCGWGLGLRVEDSRFGTWGLGFRA